MTTPTSTSRASVHADTAHASVLVATGRPRLGIGWRPEVAGVVATRADVGFAEVVAESLPGPVHPLPAGITLLLERGVEVVPHGIGLSLGGAERPEAGRIRLLADAAERLGSPMVSEHLAFVRAGGRSAGHLLAVPRTRAMVRVLVENIRIAQDQLPVPLAVEPAASLVEWPDAELTEADFVAEVVERSGALLLLDLANLYVNARNAGRDPAATLERMPLDRLAYVHVAGGRVDGGLYHDTHAEPVWPEVIELTRALVARVPNATVMLERDDRFGTDAALDAELDVLADALATGARRPPAHRPVVVAAGPRPRSGAEPEPQPPVHSEARLLLAVAQEHLLGALVGGQAPPIGFDGARMEATRRALLAKRAREVAVRWPATAAWLGDDLHPRFAAYAAANPMPLIGGPTADGAAFVASLGRSDGDDAARAEWRAAGLRTRRRWWRGG